MDMLNQLGKMVTGDEDVALSREISNAYAAERHPTPAGDLLDRLLLHAEATPQLAPPNASPATETQEARAVYMDVPTMTHTSKKRSLVSRILNVDSNTGYIPSSKMQQINWEIYHEYIERCLTQINVTSGVNF